MNIPFRLILALIYCISFHFANAQDPVEALKISHIKGNVYAYTTYKVYNGTEFPSNSMYLVTDQGIVMFDTPWDSTRLQPLLDSFLARHNKNPILSISTHFHADRTEGINMLREKNVRTYATRKTQKLCIERGEEIPEFSFKADTVFHIGGQRVEVFYPGEGHTPDNIVIWFPQEKILYGGCFIKSTEAIDLGNIADANLKEWKESIRKVMKKFPAAEIVIPGHQGWEDNRSLQYTLKLLEKTGIQ